MHIPAKPPHIRGYTLIELIVVIVVLGVALTGVTLAINRAVVQSPQALVQTRAMELAQTYLDEIFSKRYDEMTGQGGVPRCDSTDNAQQPCSNTLGNEEGGNRLLFDDVDDYHSLNEQPPTSIVDGSNLPNYDSYGIQISVVYAGTELGLASNRGAKRVTITVTTPLGNTIPVSVYRINF